MCTTHAFPHHDSAELGAGPLPLQPENLLYTTLAEDATLKIVDFGMATFADGTTVMESICGTPGYLGGCRFLVHVVFT